MGHDYGYGHGYGYGAALAVIIIVVIIIILVAIFAGLNQGGHGYLVAGHREDDTVAVRRADLRALCSQL